MKIRSAIMLLILVTGSISFGQAVPAGVVTATTNPFLPPLDGIVHYALTASELVQLGYNGPGQVTELTGFSGDVSYQGKSAALPFSLLFAGGVFLSNQPGRGAYTYSNIAVSQGLVTRTWIFNVSDSFSFLPESPTTGLSGVAGVGDLGAIPVQGPASGPAGGLLSNSGDQVTNSLSGTAERQLDHATFVNGSASWSLLRFLNQGGGEASGLDMTTFTGIVGLNRRFNARSSGSLSAVYSTYMFNGSDYGIYEPNFETRGINFSYQRTLSRTLSAGGSVGPQWVSSSDSAIIPTSLNLAANANLSYSRRYTNASVAYSRGVNGGSGVLPGALSDNISGSVGRSYGRKWVVGLNGSYVRTSGLAQLASPGSAPTSEVFDTEFGGMQVTRRISSVLSGYASYTAQNQSFNNAIAVLNAYSGISQIIGMGITFTPRSTRLGQF